jgi:hypothetical protein
MGFWVILYCAILVSGILLVSVYTQHTQCSPIVSLSLLNDKVTIIYLGFKYISRESK